MFKKYLSFAVLIAMIPVNGRAEPTNQEIMDQLKAMQKKIDDQQGQIDSQQAVIDQLNKKLAGGESKPAVTKGKVAEATEPSPTAPAYGQVGPFKYERVPGKASALLPDISAIGVFSGAYFTEDPGENGHNPSRTGFNLQEIELAIQSVIDPYARADIFFSFHEEGVELEEGYITTLGLPKGFQIRAGKMKMPFGRLNQKHLEKWYFVNDSLVNSKILGGEGFNELAFVPSYLFPTPFFLQIEGGFSQGDNEGNFDGNRKEDFAYSGRLSASWDLTPNVTLLSGGSVAFGFNDTGSGNSTNIFGGDLLLKWRPERGTGIDWQTEYIYRRRQVPGDLETEGGLYTELIGQWSRRWQAGVRFDYLGMPRNDEQHWRFSPMIKFMATEFFSLRAQYDVEDSDVTDPVQAAYLQMIFNVGPHGAHSF